MITKENGEVETLNEDEYEALVMAATSIHEDKEAEETTLCEHDTSPSLVITKVLTVQANAPDD